MQSCKVWFAFLGLRDAQPLFHDGPKNDWETEVIYLVGKSVLEQPTTLSRLANETSEYFYVGTGQEHIALPSWQGSSCPMLGWSGRRAEHSMQNVASA